MRKTILITGAGTGIGKDTAKSLLTRGHKVYATTYTQAEADALQLELGQGAQVFKLDITNPGDRAQIADLGLDVLINNAAQSLSGSLAEVRHAAIGTEIREPCVVEKHEQDVGACRLRQYGSRAGSSDRERNKGQMSALLHGSYSYPLPLLTRARRRADAQGTLPDAGLAARIFNLGRPRLWVWEGQPA